MTLNYPNMSLSVWLDRQRRLKFHKTFPRKVDLSFVEGGCSCILAADRGAVIEEKTRVLDLAVSNFQDADVHCRGYLRVIRGK
jgi:hypothetical protein